MGSILLDMGLFAKSGGGIKGRGWARRAPARQTKNIENNPMHRTGAGRRVSLRKFDTSGKSPALLQPRATLTAQAAATSAMDSDAAVTMVSISRSVIGVDNAINP